LTVGYAFRRGAEGDVKGSRKSGGLRVSRIAGGAASTKGDVALAGIRTNGGRIAP